MECVDEREQARFVKWTYRPDVRAVAPELDRTFYWVGDRKRNAAASDPACTLNDKVEVSALLMLADENDDGGLALAFRSAADATIDVESQDHWLPHLRDNKWIVLVIHSAEEARVAVMRHLAKELLLL